MQPTKRAEQLDMIAMMRDISYPPPLKASLNILLYPFFGLLRTPEKKATDMAWNENGREYYIKRVPSPEYGQPTGYDFDYLLGAVSLVLMAHNRGEPISPRIKFNVHDLLEFIGRGTSGREYKNFQAAMRRFITCTIFTNIQSGNFVSEMGFNWIQGYLINRRKLANGKEVMESAEIVLCDWLFEAIMSLDVLSIDRSYFDHTSTLERRLFLLSRAHLGEKYHFCIGMDRLHLKSGSTAPRRAFAHELREIVRTQPFKNFYIVLSDTSKEVPNNIINPDTLKVRNPMVHFIKRNSVPLPKFF